MNRVKLLALTALALLAFGAINASIAGAETESPEVLCLVAKCAGEVRVPLKGGEAVLSTLKGTKPIKAVEVTTTFDGSKCKLVGTEEKDLSLCTDESITFSKAKQGETNCRSEAANGSDKAALETITALLDLHLAAEETSAKVLQPLLLSKVLGPLLENELVINCGGVKNVVKGVVGCLMLPGLTEISTKGTVELVCKVASKDQETGTCTVLCNWLKEFPYESNLGGGFEDAQQLIKLTGSPNKDLFIDD